MASTIPPIPDALKKQHPNLEKFWPFIQTLNQESDRGRVLISTGFLEEQLKDILLAFFLEKPDARELVEGRFAPLGSFSARIATSYLLGLISEDEYYDLSLIRRIRNDFAHQIETTFETQSVVNRCRELRKKAPDYTHHELGDVKVDASGQFQTAAVALILNLINRPHYVGERRRKSEAWPY